METFFSGALKIEIEDDGVTTDGRDRVKGAIVLSDGRRWEFSDLSSGCGGYRTIMEMAESAISFGSYYSTDNRGDDVPSWAPPAEIADAIGNEACYSPSSPPDEFPERGEADKRETVYHGDLFTVFASEDAQNWWFKKM